MQAATNMEDGRDFDLLSWWKVHSTVFPNLSRMARQYLAFPASSAGVERLFSAAGRMHNDLRKNVKESTLERSLMVWKNI